MQSTVQQPTPAQLQAEAEKMRAVRKKWTLTDPVKADKQMEANRKLRLQIEGQPVLSSSYGW